MESKKAILMLIEDKKNQLLAIEELMRALSDCEIDEMESLMRRCRTAASAVDQTDHRLAGLCQEAGDPKRMLLSALSNTCERKALPDAFQEIFDAAQKNFMILTRIKKLESLISARLKIHKQDIALKIKGGTTAAKIIKYRSGIDSQTEKGVLLKHKYSKA
jgi:hypothetical protein